MSAIVEVTRLCLLVLHLLYKASVVLDVQTVIQLSLYIFVGVFMQLCMACVGSKQQRALRVEQ